MAINRKASSEVKNDKRGEKKFKGCNGTRKRKHKDIKKKRTNWGFPAESEKHNVSESQAECWTSDVSSLPLQLGSWRTGRDTCSLPGPGATSKDPSLNELTVW